jgi:hypothetical protein
VKGWFSAPEVRDYLRITIGTEQDAAALVAAVGTILGRGRAPEEPRGGGRRTALKAPADRGRNASKAKEA